MKERKDISSDFGEIDEFPKRYESLDLSHARKFSTSGTTCDAYETRYHSRRVFVKKLKKKFQNSDRYREAFRKEYEIGVSLSHPSLPVYTEFFGDSIVMNFIDGRTLADMISKKDSWLTNENNIRKLLNQLLDVIEYLHQHNVIHGDIKVDNILVTFNTHNAVLIDFDKCYSDWDDLTPGSSELYGLPAESSKNPTIDFKGLGRIAEKLISLQNSDDCKHILRKFVRSCSDENVTPDRLRAFLKESNKNDSGSSGQLSLRTRYIMGFCGAGLLLILTFGLPSLISSLDSTDTNIVSETIETNQVDSVSTFLSTLPAETRVNETQETIVSSNESPSVTQSFPTETEINKELGIIFKPLIEKMAYAKNQFNDSTLSYDSKLDLLFEIGDLQSELTQKAYSYFESKYPDTNPTDIQMAVGGSKYYQNLMAELTEMSSMMTK